jgi:hypothetical protein
MMERPILVFGVSAKQLDELIDCPATKRMELSAHAEIGDESSDEIVLAAKRAKGSGVQWFDEWKQLALLEVEVARQAGFEVRPRPKQRHRLAALPRARNVVQRSFELGVLELELMAKVTHGTLLRICIV